jgi:hypothetical protein
VRARLGEALRAGLTSLLIGLLCGAALLAPKLAGEPDFAHSHPGGTHAHLHGLELIFSSDPPEPPQTVLSRLPKGSILTLSHPSLQPAPELRSPYQSRAPPLFVG